MNKEQILQSIFYPRASDSPKDNNISHKHIKIIAIVFITPTILCVIDNKEDIFQL